MSAKLTLAILKRDLIKEGYWTRIIELNFDNPSLPVYRLVYGPIHSNGLHEKEIGRYDIFKDGKSICIDNHI